MKKIRVIIIIVSFMLFGWIADCRFRNWQRLILLSTLYSLLSTLPAFAHKVNIFAYIEGNTIYTESYFPDGRKVEGGTVEVYDSQGNKLLEGVTDKEGQFNFKPPRKDDLKIVLIASMGHRNSYTISKDELPEGKMQEVEQVNLEKLKQIIDTSLDEKIMPIMREIKRQKKVSFTEIVGGIGYIFGIFGLILYFATRKKEE